MYNFFDQNVITWGYKEYIALLFRCWILFSFADYVMFLQMKFLQSLLVCWDHSSNFCKTKRSKCLKYFEQLLRVGQKIQKLLWPMLLSRLIIDILYFTRHCYMWYWFPSLIRPDYWISRLLPMTSLHMVYMARCIYKLEHQILNNLYQEEFLRSLSRQKVTKNVHMIKVSAYRSFTLFFT